MAGWDNFFVANVGSSAALVGLIFVGLSINLQRIITLPGIPARAFEGMLVLLNVLVISLIMLVPGQSLELIGGEIMVIGALSWLIITWMLIRNVSKFEKKSFSYIFCRAIFSQISTLPFVIGGLTILAYGLIGFYCIVPGIIFSFLLALLNAWVLLIEINR